MVNKQEEKLVGYRGRSNCNGDSSSVPDTLSRCRPARLSAVSRVDALFCFSLISLLWSSEHFLSVSDKVLYFGLALVCCAVKRKVKRDTLSLQWLDYLGDSFISIYV